MKKLRSKKFLSLIVLALVFAAVLTPVLSFAQTTAEEVKTFFEIGAIGLSILTISAKIMVLAAGLVDFAVRLGNDVLTLPAVLAGWRITLSLTNLGFVLAIIIIAFATMLRMESYGMKKTLWKLIAAALLVNFSLVIAGAVMSVSKITSDIFYEAAMGNNNLSDALANAMKPQALLNIKEKSVYEAATDYIGDTFSISGWIKYFINLAFILIFTFFTILAFISLFIMLLIRAIALVFLLVLSPLVWFCWILPTTEEYWKKWWKEFIRWNVFAPLIYFFIYLAIMTAGEIQKTPLSSVTAAKSAVNNAASVFNNSGVTNDMLTHVANLFVVLGLLFGGIYLANTFGIAGGGLAYGWAQGAGKAVGGWARNKGARFGTSPFRSKRGREWIEKVQKGESWLGKIPFGKRIGHGLSRVGVAKGEDLFKQAGERFKDLSDKQLALRVSTMSRDERAAALARLAKNGNLDLIPGGAEKYIKDAKTKKIFESYGKKKEYDDFEKAAGINTAAANATGGEKRELLKEFYKKYKPGEFSKIGKDIFFDDKSPDAKLHLEALMDTNPGALGKLFFRLSGDEFEKFNDKIIENIKDNLPDEFEGDVGKGKREEIKRFSKGYLLTRGSQEELKKGIMAYLKKEKKDLYSAYSKHLANRLQGFEYKEFKEKTES